MNNECVPEWQDAPAGAEWVSRQGCTLSDANGSIVFYRIEFDIPNASAAAATKLAGTVWADNSVASVEINGSAANVPANTVFNGPGASFGDWPSNLYIAGKNTMIIGVKNSPGPGNNPEGLLVSVPNAFTTGSTCAKP